MGCSAVPEESSFDERLLMLQLFVEKHDLFMRKGSFFARKRRKALRLYAPKPSIHKG
jgi:hypothetical protein